jgi:hypothetical protein
LTGDLLLSSHLDREGGNVRDMVHLRPNEGVVIRISVGKSLPSGPRPGT